MAKVIAVVSQKGGVGKTTTAVNLAAALAREGQAVLLIETDPQGAVVPSTGAAHTLPQHALLNVLREDVNVLDALCKSSVEGLHLLPAVKAHEPDELDLEQIASAHPMALREVVDPLMARYDTILLDGPPTLGPLTRMTLAAADRYLIPVQAEESSYRTLDRMFAVIEEVRRDYNPDLECEGLLLTMVDLRTRMSVRVVNQLNENYGDKVLLNMIPRTVSLQDMPVSGRPTVVDAPSSRGGRAYLEVAQEVLAGHLLDDDQATEMDPEEAGRLLEATLNAQRASMDVLDEDPLATMSSMTLISDLRGGGGADALTYEDLDRRGANRPWNDRLDDLSGFVDDLEVDLDDDDEPTVN
jgi:chromosome partitioning protein